MTDTDALREDFKETPFWWEGATFDKGDGDRGVPKTADVAVIGGGLTGVSAAYELARGGRSVVVFDAEEPGQGASSRNAGFLGRHTKHSYLELCEAVGIDAARTLFAEMREIYDAAVGRIRDEGIDCGFRKCGRFVGALSPRGHSELVREFEARARQFGEEVEFIPASEKIEIGSKLYHGGVLIVENASIHPDRHFQGLRRRAEKTGALIVGHTPVLSLQREKARFDVNTPRGSISVRDVLIATNGYSWGLAPWIDVRLSPIDGYMVATEPLPDGLAKELFPFHRTYIDNRRNFNYMQLSSDGNRLLFGGRTGRWAASLRQRARELHQDMASLFPQLRSVRLTHGWTGRCAMTWDAFPRTGVHQGINYSLGYCFSGNAMGPHLGTKAARRILGTGDAQSFFDRTPFPKMPWPARRRWAITTLARYYEWADRPQPRTN